MLFALLYLSSFLHIVAANTAFILPESSLTFSSGWEGSSSQVSGTFFFTDTLGHALSVEIPVYTATINYVGLKRTGGSLYGVCVDCDKSSVTNLQLFSGHDSTLHSNVDAEPTTIFSLSVDPRQSHTLQITNIGDSSFGDKSELTFVSFVVIQNVSITTSTSITPPRTTSSSIMTSSSSRTSVTTTSASFTSITTTSASFTTSATTSSTSVSSSSDLTSETATTSSTSSPSSNATLIDNQTKIVVIIAPTMFGVLSLAVGLFFYCRKRRRKDFLYIDSNEIDDEPQYTHSVTNLIPSPSSNGFLAMAGRKKPLPRLPEPYPYIHPVPQDGPLFPVRRLNSTS
ncbi:hypothetical protein EV361DRAFT_896980 [Lentinula raphanica]|nr:hypothetical protein F5880DRAFT_1540621 [Lentinula raphanica]KAJ3973946.1 hypothetical protein EV361DRAFT_896980 [Lentinula raphanica]